MLHMNANRTERITVNLTAEQVERLDRFAERNHWSRSTAVAVLIERWVKDEQA
jgi:metal-responsive CopG/Arc/MetJ family transcriptional regulator